MRLSARRVRWHRRYIAANRCPVSPGLTHNWGLEYSPDPSSYGGVVEYWRCPKCGDEN